MGRIRGGGIGRQGEVGSSGVRERKAGRIHTFRLRS